LKRFVVIFKENLNYENMISVPLPLVWKMKNMIKRKIKIGRSRSVYLFRAVGTELGYLGKRTDVLSAVRTVLELFPCT